MPLRPTSVPTMCKGHDRFGALRLDPPRRGPAAVAMDQPGGAVCVERRPQPPDLSLGQSEQISRLARPQIALAEAIEDPCPSLLAGAHRDRLHVRRLTKSLIS